MLQSFRINNSSCSCAGSESTLNVGIATLDVLVGKSLKVWTHRGTSGAYGLAEAYEIRPTHPGCIAGPSQGFDRFLQTQCSRIFRGGHLKKAACGDGAFQPVVLKPVPFLPALHTCALVSNHRMQLSCWRHSCVDLCAPGGGNVFHAMEIV